MSGSTRPAGEDPAPRCKVLLLAPSLDSIGGIQNYVRTLQAALRQVLGKDSVRLVTVPGEPEWQRHGAQALRSSVKLRFAASALSTALRWAPDLVICTHVGTALAALLIHAVSGAPYWVVLHGIEIWSRLSLAKLNALEAAECLVANTNFTLAAAARRHSLHPSRVLILSPALPPSPPLSPVAPDSANPHWLPSGDETRPIVLTVGRLAASERYKGHDVMLDAWPAVLRRAPGAVYWIVGGGDDLPRLEHRARSMGIAPSVRFIGPLPPAQLALCYDRCSIFAMPARTELDGPTPRGEGFGIAFLEAMAHGKPVIGPRDGAPAEFIHSGEHGWLVDPADPDQVAAAIIRLLDDPQAARRMGQAAREWVTCEFSFERFCERLRRALSSRSTGERHIPRAGR